MSCESNRYSHSVYPCVSATGNNQYKVPVTCWLIQIRSSGNDHSSQNNLLSRLTYLSWEPYGATMPSMQTQSLSATSVGVKSPGVVVSHPPAWARYVSGKSPGLWKVTRKNRKHHVNAIVEDLPKRVWNNDFPASAAWISASAARVPAKLNPQPRPAKNSLGNRRASPKHQNTTRTPTKIELRNHYMCCQTCWNTKVPSCTPHPDDFLQDKTT